MTPYTLTAITKVTQAGKAGNLVHWIILDRVTMLKPNSLKIITTSLEANTAQTTMILTKLQKTCRAITATWTRWKSTA
jgi:hypothetical protein